MTFGNQGAFHSSFSMLFYFFIFYRIQQKLQLESLSIFIMPRLSLSFLCFRSSPSVKSV